MRLAGVKICGTVRICQSLCRGRRPHRPLQRITFRIHKKILPSRRFGTRAYCFVVPPKFGGGSTPPSCAGERAAQTRRFRRGAPYTHARRMSFPALLQEPFSVMALSLGRQADRYCFRVVANDQSYRIVFLFFIIMRQSRSPRCRPRISISAEARFVAHGTLDESHRRSVRMMR